MASGAQESRDAISRLRPRGRVGPRGERRPGITRAGQEFKTSACEIEKEGLSCRKDGAENSGILIFGPGPDLTQNLVRNRFFVLNCTKHLNLIRVSTGAGQE